jgi:hypothetical protein
MMTELSEAWMGGALCDLPQLGQSRAEGVVRSSGR